MLYSYKFQAEDKDSDRGTADCTITAESETQAREMLNNLCKEIGSRDLDFTLISERPFETGIVFHNIEKEPEIVHDQGASARQYGRFRSQRIIDRPYHRLEDRLSRRA